MKFQQFLENQGTYVGVKVDSASSEWLQELQKTLKLNNPLESSKFHATVLYSRNGIEVPSTGNSYDAEAYRVDSWKDQEGKSVVIVKLKSEGLKNRHDDLIDAGGTHDFPEYNAHITLSYDDAVKPLDISQPINLIDEYSEPLDLDWVEKSA
ncbi:RNA ligase [Vibrio phage D479]